MTLRGDCAPTAKIDMENEKSTSMSLRRGKYQKAARRLADAVGTVTTQQVMHWAHRDRGSLRQRWKRARAARRACTSIGLIPVRRIWPGGIVWAKADTPSAPDR
jgi:hypothetical protein